MGATGAAMNDAERNLRAAALADLVLHREAIRCLEADPRLRSSIQEKLTNWPASLARPWNRALELRDWSEVLADNETGAALRRESPLLCVLPPSLHAAIANSVCATGAQTLAQLDPAELQRAKASAATQELHKLGVVAEVFGSLVWGQWDAAHSDVDILILERGIATETDVEAIVSLFVGSPFDIVYLDSLREPSREYLLKQLREHGLPTSRHVK